MHQQQQSFSPFPFNLALPSDIVPQNPASRPATYVQGQTATSASATGTIVSYSNFETGVGAFTVSGGSTGTIYTSSAWSHSGNYSLAWAGPGQIKEIVPVPGGGLYQYSGWLFSQAAGVISFNIQANNQTFGGSPTSVSVNVPAGVPTYFSLQTYLPPNAISTALYFNQNGSSRLTYIDDVIITRLSTVADTNIYITTNFQQPFPKNVTTPYPLNLINGIYPQNTSPANIPAVYVQGDAATAYAVAGTLLNVYNFENGIQGWTAGVGAVLSTSNAWSNTGNNSLSINPAGNANAQANISVPVPAAGVYQFSGVLYSNQSVGNVRVRVNLLAAGPASGTIIQNIQQLSLTAGVPLRFTLDCSVPSNVTFVQLNITTVTGGAAVIYADDLVFSRITDYTDGVYIATPYQQPTPVSPTIPYPLNLVNGVYPQNSRPANIPGVLVQGSSAVNFVSAPTGFAYITANFTPQFPFASTTPYPVNIITKLKPQHSYKVIQPVNVNGSVANVMAAAIDGGVAEFISENSSEETVQAHYGSVFIASVPIQQWRVRLVKPIRGKVYKP